MLSNIPAIVVVLTLTATAPALRRAWLGLVQRRAADAPGDDQLLARVEVAVSLGWAIFFLLHFVLLAALVESREVGRSLSIAGALAGGLALVSALLSLARALRGER
jgi:hypothetical protein